MTGAGGAPVALRVAAIVAAAGRGDRLGLGVPKALQPLGGLPLLVHAVRALAAAPSVDLVVVAAPPDHVSRTEALLVGHHEGALLRVVAGGASRPESVRAGLAALPREVTLVLVHDAARPLVPVGLVESVAVAVAGGAQAVVPALPVVDTVKQVAGATVVATVDRAPLRSAQTPQGFRRDVLEKAYDGPGWAAADITDDAGLVERLGLAVTVVPGHPEAFKVTRPLDLVLAEAVLAERAARAARAPGAAAGESR